VIVDRPRQIALDLLNQLDFRGATLDALLEQALALNAGLDRRDRAFLQTLVYGVLRRRAHLDWILAHFSKRSLGKIEPPVLNVLRIGLFQAVYLSKVPPAAAVNTSVELSKSLKNPWVTGFVNGILRSAMRGYRTVPLPDRQTNPAAALATEKSFPEWMIERWLDRWGRPETEALCDVLNRIPPVTVRTNTLRTTRDRLMQALKSEARDAEAAPMAPEGIALHGLVRPIPEMDAFKEGWFQVQDEAAQMVIELLSPRPGEIILDACAGQGGKTGHIAQKMGNRGRIVAADRDRAKLARLEGEMRRLGISIVETRPMDLDRPVGDPSGQMFDRILLDAPCSGLGVIRRHPDIKWNPQKQNLHAYQQRQIAFLDHLAPLLKSSGTLTYVVCSSEPEENEAVVEKFLDNHHEFDIFKNWRQSTAVPSNVIDQNGFFRTLPHHHATDGFFAAVFRRQ